MPAPFLKRPPPFKAKLDEKVMARILEMREAEKVSFTAIAKELCLTQTKAKHAYEWCYYRKVEGLIRSLQEETPTQEEKTALWTRCFSGYKSSKKREDMLMRELAE